jgi:hypothetical protein
VRKKCLRRSKKLFSYGYLTTTMNTIKKCKFALKAVISGKLGLNFSEELKV